MSHTFSPEADRRAEALGGIAALMAAILAVVVFLPPEGRILVPVHDVLEGLLGRTTFVAPLGLALVSGIAFARRKQSHMSLPRRRLAGLVVITIALLPSERLLGQSTGAVGEWFTGFLLALFGTPVAIAFTTALMAIGIILTFDLRRWRRPVAAR